MAVKPELPGSGVSPTAGTVGRLSCQRESVSSVAERSKTWHVIQAGTRHTRAP